MGEIRGGLSELDLKHDDAGDAGCHHCVWAPALWWDARELFGLTD